ncbi:MAG TPA: hypothetical protein PKD55_16185, partial [Bellilinea sp.]|nr:hypothetical protein [Bellilinea sp.]
ETHCRTRDRFMFALNRGVYLGMLTVLAFAQGRRQRLALVRQAERDGRAARLGHNPRYPL